MAFGKRRRSIKKDRNKECIKYTLYNADVAKLADAQVSDSCGQPCGFESLRPHHDRYTDLCLIKSTGL